MRSNKKPTAGKTKLIWIAAMAAVLVLLIVLAVNIFAPESQEEPSDFSGPMIEVETPYCVLEYSEQWKDQMSVEESNADGCLAETFYANIAGAKYALYTVYFGDSADGELFGFLPGTDGKDIPVYIACYSLGEGISLTEEERSLFYSMMEGVNTVTRSISSAEGYYVP